MYTRKNLLCDLNSYVSTSNYSQPLENQPLPIEKSEVVDYLVDLKRDFQFFMEESPYYLKLSEPKNDIKRYSDKYKSNGQPTSNSAALRECDINQSAKFSLIVIYNRSFPRSIDEIHMVPGAYI